MTTENRSIKRVNLWNCYSKSTIELNVKMSDRDLERHKILDSVDTKKLFGRDESAIIEWNIDNIVKEAKDGKFKRYTVDKAPLR